MSISSVDLLEILPTLVYHLFANGVPNLRNHGCTSYIIITHKASLIKLARKLNPGLINNTAPKS